MSFQEQMLDQTFEMSRLALNNAVLLNGAAASALLAFLGLAAPPAREPLTTAVIWFGCGAGLGGSASVVAYLGQRCNWEYSKDEAQRKKLESGRRLAALACHGRLSCVFCGVRSRCVHGCACIVSSLRMSAGNTSRADDGELCLGRLATRTQIGIRASLRFRRK